MELTRHTGEEARRLLQMKGYPDTDTYVDAEVWFNPITGMGAVVLKHGDGDAVPAPADAVPAVPGDAVPAPGDAVAAPGVDAVPGDAVPAPGDNAVPAPPPGVDVVPAPGDAGLAPGDAVQGDAVPAPGQDTVSEWMTMFQLANELDDPTEAPRIIAELGLETRPHPNPALASNGVVQHHMSSRVRMPNTR